MIATVAVACSIRYNASMCNHADAEAIGAIYQRLANEAIARRAAAIAADLAALENALASDSHTEQRPQLAKERFARFRRGPRRGVRQR